MNDFSQFEKAIGVSFRDKSLLKTAFTHRSYLNENRNARIEHNERLEFLGDAVLELAVTEYLFEKYPAKPEGELTSFRSALVNAATLSKIAAGLSMNDFLLLSRGEARDTGRARQIILANAIEALIGAIFLDQGYVGAKDFIARNILPLTDEIVSNRAWLDPKSHFQERAQEVFGVTPSYETLSETGPDHDKHFLVGVFIGREKVAVGDGKSKQEAEQNAADKGLAAKGWLR
jgi:ribonuclease-3